MHTQGWNRRRLLQTGAQITAGAACLGLRAHAAQLPAPEPLHDDRLSFIVTTEGSPWQPAGVLQPSFQWDQLNLNIGPEQIAAAQANAHPIEGFGACFNELGWTSLSALAPADRDSVLRELFDPSAGARFTYCRMPVGANDFALGWYSYDETDGDFALDHFSVAHDEHTLIPFIQAAQQHQPALRLWASPWSPPTWMKRNRFYAEAAGQYGMSDNGIRPDQVGHEGEDLFIQEPRYFKAYARYFGRFIQAYRAHGIRVGMVMPQNEFNSAQNFPSCTWTAEGLARFSPISGRR